MDFVDEKDVSFFETGEQTGKLPRFSITGPLVFLMFTLIAFAMMWASVVFPKPGGPLSRICSSTSPRFFAASTSTASRSQTFSWPVNSLNIGGRSEISKAGSGDGTAVAMREIRQDLQDYQDEENLARWF